MAGTVKSEQEGSFLIDDAFSTNIDLSIDPFHSEEDEIAQEFDVYLSPELANKLQLLQFPLQQAAFSSPNAARIKPQHCMMELDFSTPENVGEHGGYQMATRSYTSHTIPVGTHMAMGRMINTPGFEGLHLVPLSRITQMRPTFKHVDEATASATSTTEEDTLKAEAELSLGRKPLSFQKKESERAAMIRKSTYAYKLMSEESELWQNLTVHDHESVEAVATMDKVTEGTSQHNLMTLNNSNKTVGPLNDEYIGTLNYLPGRKKGHELADDESDAIVVVTKLVDLMQEGWPIPFKILKNQFQSSLSENVLIEALASCAFLVRGNFVLQSKLLSFNASISHARTFLLFLFQTIEIVHRRRLEQVYEDDDEVTPEIILMLLKQVGRLTSDGWRLRVEDDPSFGQDHPDAIAVHVNFWTSQLRRFQPLLDLYRQDST